MFNKEFTYKLQSCTGGAVFDEDMKKHTTFKIGGNADCLVNVSSVGEITAVVSLCREYGVPFMVMGNGSNLLVDDGGIRGVVIKTENMNSCQIQGEYIYADCGVLLSRLATTAMANSLSGLEFAGGIPGSVGGGVYMNAGAYGG
ncbi:MAG: FAD-binding protein, partial [Oscillospiraceae bacterium]|nr:FAD-binding protein [Oscillospiraceae bacterium]